MFAYTRTGEINNYTYAILMAVFGIITVVISQITGISQIYTASKTKNTSGTSIWTYIIFNIMSLVSITWGFCFYFQCSLYREWIIDRIPPWLHQWTVIPVLVYYVSDILYSSVMIYIKAKHMKLSKKLHMSELDLADYLKDKQNQKYLKSGKKFYHSQYFAFAMIVTVVTIALATFATLFTILTEPLIGTWLIKPFKPEFVMSLSIIGAFAWEAVSWPQFIKCIKNRDTSGIAFNWAIFLPIACTLSFIYALFLFFWSDSGGVNFASIGGIVFNGLIVNYGILIIKLKNIKAAKKHNLTEIEYTEQILAPAVQKRKAKKLAKLGSSMKKQAVRLEKEANKKTHKKKRA